MTALLLVLGCSGDDEGAGGPSGGAGRDSGVDFGNPGSSTPIGSPDLLDAGPDGSAFVNWEGCKLVELRKLDLLFVVDNSGSMREEQASLRREFPELVRTLTTGDLDADGAADFPPVQDLHLGVISTDMGLPGVTGIDRCDGAGDDGVLLHTADPSLVGCAESYPSFLSYRGDQDDPVQVADDFACIASLGTSGCGFEQQLEAPLKALTPSSDTAITFLAAGASGSRTGRGDLENAGFARPADDAEPSVLGIVLVTDEEDCSYRDSRFLAPPTALDPADPLAMQALNLRCFHNPDQLFSIERYVNGFRRLRPGREELVVFAAITGVPPDLVDGNARNGVDFADATERDAYYDGLLDDARMQEVPDPDLMGLAGNLVPSCNTENGKAYPPRRIVELARQMGESGIVQSICQDDFGPAMSEIIQVLALRVEDLCNVQ
jgi:hypothetical protein